MSRGMRVAVGALVVLAVAVVGAGAAIQQRWGPWAQDTELATEVLRGDPSVAFDGRLDVPARDTGPCADFSLPRPVGLSDAAVTGTTVGGPSDPSIVVRLPGGGVMLLVCLGSTGEVGTPAELALSHLVDGDRPMEFFASQSRPARVVAPFGEAVRWSASIEGGARLTDWYIDRDGGLLAIGYLRHPADSYELPLVESMIAGLSWL